jgi:hypothetical protein
VINGATITVTDTDRGTVYTASLLRMNGEPFELGSPCHLLRQSGEACDGRSFECPWIGECLFEKWSVARRSTKLGAVNPSTYRLPKSRRKLSKLVAGFRRMTLQRHQLSG